MTWTLWIAIYLTAGFVWCMVQLQTPEAQKVIKDVGKKKWTVYGGMLLALFIWPLGVLCSILLELKLWHHRRHHAHLDQHVEDALAKRVDPETLKRAEPPRIGVARPLTEEMVQEMVKAGHAPVCGSCAEEILTLKVKHECDPEKFAAYQQSIKEHYERIGIEPPKRVDHCDECAQPIEVRPHECDPKLVEAYRACKGIAEDESGPGAPPSGPESGDP